MTWSEYHDATKHSVESLARTRHTLDWANMPDPFRHYEGAPLIDLPPGSTGFLSTLLFHSAAISASKLVSSTGFRYALRVNPSSGNLHPTEFHFAQADGLYHYRPSSHMLEQRASGDFCVKLGIDAPIVFVLTSIAWREAWKYQRRAYRYCLHDIGHAWQSLALAARALGCEAVATGQFPDDEIAHTLRLSPDEWPMLLLALHGPATPSTVLEVWTPGEPNLLSTERIEYPLIDAIHAATSITRTPIPIAPPVRAGTGELTLPPPAASLRPFFETVRQRRSALDFIGGSRSMTLAQLAALLDATAQPYAADFAAARFVQLYLYVHRVEDLAPGVYRHWPATRSLERVRSGDQRMMAARLSLGQDLAGNACVAFSMIGDIARAAQTFGDRAYRYVHFEAGAIGHRLYLAAESQGLQATGIGAFYDDEVHRYLEIEPDECQVVYHFAVGYAVPDPRLEG